MAPHPNVSLCSDHLASYTSLEKGGSDHDSTDDAPGQHPGDRLGRRSRLPARTQTSHPGRAASKAPEPFSNGMGCVRTICPFLTKSPGWHVPTSPPRLWKRAGWASWVLHRCGKDFYFLLVSTWRHSNEIWETVFYKNGDAMPDFAPFPRDGAHKPCFCVWELAPVWHEKEAWTRFLTSARDEARSARCGWKTATPVGLRPVIRLNERRKLRRVSSAPDSLCIGCILPDIEARKSRGRGSRPSRAGGARPPEPTETRAPPCSSARSLA